MLSLSKPLLIFPLCSNRIPQLGLLLILEAVQASRRLPSCELACPMNAWDQGWHIKHGRFTQGQGDTSPFLLKLYPLSALLNISSPNHFYCSKKITEGTPLPPKGLTVKPTTSTSHGLPEPKSKWHEDKNFTPQPWRKPKNVTCQ